jgi:hypothetical protein
MSRLGTETAFEVLARAALGAGPPHRAPQSASRTSTHPPTSCAPVRKRSRKLTHYGPSAGLPALREAIAADYSRHRGDRHSAGAGRRLSGGKPVMFFMFLALLEEGDQAIYPNRFRFESMIQPSARKPCRCRCGSRTGSGPTSEAGPSGDTSDKGDCHQLATDPTGSCSRRICRPSASWRPIAVYGF